MDDEIYQFGYGESLPTRGAWIETPLYAVAITLPSCRSLPGERGLKQNGALFVNVGARVAPYPGSVD